MHSDSDIFEKLLRSDNIAIEKQVSTLEQALNDWTNNERNSFNEYILKRFQSFIYVFRDNILIQWDASYENDDGLTFSHTLSKYYLFTGLLSKSLRVFEKGLWVNSQDKMELYRNLITEEMRRRIVNIKGIARIGEIGFVDDEVLILSECDEIDLINIMWKSNIIVPNKFEKYVLQAEKLIKLMIIAGKDGEMGKFIKDYEEVDGIVQFIDDIIHLKILMEGSIDKTNYYCCWHLLLFDIDKPIYKDEIQDIIKHKLIETNNLWPYWVKF